MYHFDENDSNSYIPTEASYDNTLTNHTNELFYISAPTGQISNSSYYCDGRYVYYPNNYSVSGYDDSAFSYYQASSLSLIPGGYYFERGSYIYTVEVAGTTYYYQNAVPVYSYADDRMYNFDECNSNGSCCNIQEDTIADESLSQIEYYHDSEHSTLEIPQSSSCYDVSRPLLSTVSNVMVNGNLVKQESSGITEKVVERKSSVQNERIYNYKKNEKVLRAVENKIPINTEKTCNKERNKYVKKEDKKWKPKVKRSFKNEVCARSSDVFESEKILNQSSAICDKVWNLEDNKIFKPKHKDGNTKAAKSVKNENHATNEKVYFGDLIKKSEKKDEHKACLKTDDGLVLQVKKGVKNSMKNKIHINSDEACDLETNKNPEQEDKNGKLEVRISVKGQNCNHIRDDSKSLKELIISYGKGNKGKNKIFKQKLKKMQEMSVISVKNKNSVEHDELRISEMIVKNQKLDEHKRSFKNYKVCDVEANKEMKNPVKHKIHIDIQNGCNLEENKNIKQGEKNRKVEAKILVKNQNCLQSDHLSTSEKELQLSSVKGDTISNTEINKNIKKKLKKKKGKAVKSAENKNSLGNREGCTSELIAKVQTLDKCDSSVEISEMLDVNNSVENEIYIKSDEICQLETYKNINPEVKKRKSKDKHSLKNLDCGPSTHLSKSNIIEYVKNSVCSKDYVKCDEVDNAEQNKKRDKKRKKRKFKVKESVVVKECVESDGVCNLDLNETFQKSDKQRTSVKSDEPDYLRVNGKESSKFKEVSNSQQNKKIKRKRNKRKLKVKELVEIKESIKNDEFCNLDLNETFQKSKEQCIELKSNESFCILKVNGKDETFVKHKSPLSETPENNVCYEKYASESKKNIILNSDENQPKDTEIDYFNIDFNLGLSEKNTLFTLKKEITTIHTNNFDKSSEEHAVVVTDDNINIIVSSPVKENGSLDFHEVDLRKTAKNECKKSKINILNTVEYLNKDTETFKEIVSSIKEEEPPDSNLRVPSGQSNSHLHLPGSESELTCEDISKSTASGEIDDSCPEIESTPSDEIKANDMDEENKSEVKRKKKKKRFQKIRKWINSLCCCRKNQPS